MESHGKLKIETFIEPSFQENGFLLWSGDGPECWLVDPGFPPEQTEQFAAAVRKRELTPAAIVITHAHVDHIAGISELRSILGEVPIVCPRGEEHMLVNPADNLSTNLGMAVTAPPPERTVGPGDLLSLGELEWQVLDVSGHSPAGVAYYCAAASVALVGDAVFADSIGRYDFPHSSREHLLSNIRDNLLTLPEETVIYCGHGPPATVKHIKRYNQVLRWELQQC